jgi:hypothetical protein
MNIATQPETPLPGDRNRIAAGYVPNRDKLDDEVEKYRHLEELAELFLKVKTAPPTGTASRAHS